MIDDAGGQYDGDHERSRSLPCRARPLTTERMQESTITCPETAGEPSFFVRCIGSPSIRMTLALLVFACVMPIAIVAELLIVDYYEREQIRLSMSSVIQARGIVAAVDRDIVSTQAALLALGTSQQLATGNLAGFHARAKEALRNLNADSIFLMDSTGQLLLSTRRSYGEVLPKVANPAPLQHVFETGKPGVSDIFIDPMINRPIYTIAVPIKRDGTIVYSLHATAPPIQHMAVLASQKLPRNWISVVTDSTGTIAARSHEMERFSNKKVVPTLLEEMKTASEGSFKTITLEGIPVHTAFSRSPITNWMAAIGTPLAELNAGLRQTLAWLVAASITALVFGLWLAWLIGGRIAKSITILAEPAIALASGEMLEIPNLYFREANEMRQSLMNAAIILRQSRFDANHDPLTGMANRTLFHISLRQQLALCRRNKTELCLLYIDLDGFKAVNDTHGHEVGDQLLREVTLRLAGAIRDSDITARLGGDEFAIALINSDQAKATEFATRLIETISAPYLLGDIETRISASIGVAGYPASASDIDTLLRRADQAMYKAKSSGKRRVCLAAYDSE